LYINYRSETLIPMPNNEWHLQPIKHYLTKLVSPLVEGVGGVEWSAVVGAVKRQYVRV